MAKNSHDLVRDLEEQWRGIWAVHSVQKSAQIDVMEIFWSFCYCLNFVTENHHVYKDVLDYF